MSHRLPLFRAAPPPRRLFVAGRYYFPQPIGGIRKFRNGGVARLLLEPSDQPRNGKRAAELSSQVEHRNRDGGHLRIALTERDVVAALAHGFCSRTLAVGKGEQHMGTGPRGQRQRRAFVEMVPRG